MSRKLFWWSSRRLPVGGKRDSLDWNSAIRVSAVVDGLFTPKKSGTPKKNEITFIAPTGEKLVSRKQLEQYLRSHPSGLALHEFEWSTTGETPRRSARLSEKAKAVAPPKPQPKKKRARRTSSATKKNDAETEVTPEELHEIKEAGAVDESVEVKITAAIVSPHEGAEVVNDEEGREQSVETNKDNKEIKRPMNNDAEVEKSNATGTQDTLVKSHNQIITADKDPADNGNTAVAETMEHQGDRLNSAGDRSTERPVDAKKKSEENELKVSPATTNLVVEHHRQVVGEVGKQFVKENKSSSTTGRDMDPKQQSFMQPGRIDGQQHLTPTLSC